ncbi:NAD(P)H-binding protein [Mesobacillus harenae]|uniref:NAD(P)H-binding protein n=1 Tax=Mesobacillus harenae TaxID=2213203 RepID=UPI001580DDC5|nr:NAD(P)H-binding protein [Mesobacillus harenae]
MNGKSALIAGSTGLVGNELLHFLLEGEEYEKVIAIVRKPLELKHPKLQEVVADYDHLEDYHAHFTADDVFCCLGTTIKKAKTKEAMHKVDVEYPLEIARLAIAKGAKHYLLVSSMNANPEATFWYPKMKGELEQELRKIPFETISIVRPSLLLGNRNEFRMGERTAEVLFKFLSPVFKGPLKQFRAITGRNVALAMYKIAQTNPSGTTIYPSVKLEEIAQK